MFNSVRTRLTAWYTGVLAFVLIFFAVFTYLFLNRTIDERTDRTLTEIASAFENTFNSEIADALKYNDDDDEHDEKPPEIKSGDKLERRMIEETVSDLRFRNYRLFVFDAAQNLITQSADSTGRDNSRFAGEILPEALPTLIEKFRNPPDSFFKQSFSTLSLDGRQWRVAAQILSFRENSLILIVAHPLDEENELRSEIQVILVLAIPLSLFGAGIGGYFLARKALAPVAAMSRQAAFITAQNLHERLPIGNKRDELGSLAQNFNALLARLDDAFAQQRRFMADASHELRTPIAIVRGESEIALSKKNRSVADYQESLEIVHDESRRMSRIVEDLMTLARIDAGQAPLDKKQLRLDELIAECIRSVRVLADEKHITVNNRTELAMPFAGDDGLLRRMLLNLLDNAVKYNNPGGRIEVSAESKNSHFIITLSDTGRGISAENQVRIFERFFREDNARTRSETVGGSGAGLGLAIARWIVEAHHGSLSLQSSTSAGTTFVVSFPVGNRPG